MNWRDRVTLDAAVLAGKPVVRGTRLALDFIVGLLGQGWTEADIPFGILAAFLRPVFPAGEDTRQKDVPYY